MGFGIGLVFPVGNMLVIAFFDGEMRAKMLGLGNVLANAGAMVFVTVGGLLATTRWNNVFLVHLVLVIILILILFLPEPAKDEISQEANSAVKPKMPGIAWLYIFGLGLCMVFIFPIMLYMSSIIEANNLGTAAEAGYVISSFTVAGMVGGLAFAKLFSKFGTKIFAFSTCLLAIGMSLLVIGNTIIFMYIGCIICGFGFIQIMSAVFWGIGSDVPPALVPSVAGFATASMNIFNFTSPYVHTFLSRLVGMSGNLKAPFFFAIFFFVASTVVFLFSAKKKVFYQDKFIPPIH
jgi:MFS family permease